MSFAEQEDFNIGIWYDLSKTFLGKKIGEGAFRKVYQHRIDDDLVFKIEDSGEDFYNAKEWHIWEELKDTAFGRRWLAPCEHISPSGTVLIQARTVPVAAAFLPAKVPECLKWDAKPANWGWYKGRVVCHDYGHMRLLGNKKLTKITWYD